MDRIQDALDAFRLLSRYGAAGGVGILSVPRSERKAAQTLALPVPEGKRFFAEYFVRKGLGLTGGVVEGRP